MTNCQRESNSCSLVWRKKHRGHFEIIASILEAVKDNGASRYSIMTHSSTNFPEIKKYLKSLTDIGFIETNVKEGRVLYRISEKGLDFLRQYNVLLEMMRRISF